MNTLFTDIEFVNHTQIELMVHSGMEPDAWIQSFSAKFRELIEKNVITSDTKLDAIERFLYKQEAITAKNLIMERFYKVM